MKSQGSKLLLTFSGLVVLLGAAARADAQSAADKKSAQALQTEGVRLLERGDNREALKKFQDAIRIFPSPKILFNMGRAHVALGEDVEAVNDFERFLDEAPYAPKPSRDEAQKIIESLRPKLAYIEIATDDVNVRISIDGKEVGVAPLTRPLAIAPGAHEVRLDKPEMLADTRSVAPVAGQKVRIFIKLRPAKPGVVAAAPPPDRSKLAMEPPPPEPIRADPSAHRAGDEPDVAPTATTGSGPGRRALKWAAWGAAVASAGVGTYGFFANRSGVETFDAGCGFELNTNTPIADPQIPNNTRTNQDCVALKNSYESSTRIAVVGFIGAGVLTAAGFIFWVTETPAFEGHTALLSCVPSVSAAREPGLACAMRF